MSKAKVHQTARKFHRWVSLIVGVQLLLWTLSGLFMASNSIERVRSEHLQQKQTQALPLDSVQLPESIRTKLNAYPDLKKLSLVNVANSPAWLAITGSETTPSILFDSKTGQRLSPLQEATILEIARRDYMGSGKLKDVQKIDKAVSSDYRGPFPVWVATYSEPQGYRIYIDPHSGAIVARRSLLWRVYDFLWMLHIMDYEEHENFNNWLLIVASAFALTTSVSGLLLLFFVFRRSDFLFFAKKQTALKRKKKT